jgi:hypothetical protein
MVLTRHFSRLRRVHNSRHLRSGRLVDVFHTPRVVALALSSKSKPVRYRSQEWILTKSGDVIEKHEADPEHGPDSELCHEPCHICAATRGQTHPGLPAPREETTEKVCDRYLGTSMENMRKTFPIHDGHFSRR